MPPIPPKGDRITAAKFRVKYKDVFDMAQFYKDLHDWLDEYGWKDYENKKDYYENFYLEKVDMGGLKEILIKWRPLKIPDGSNYYCYWLDFDFHCIALKATEIVKEGVKLKAHKGEVELTVTATLEIDYRGDFKSHPILKLFRKLFQERIMRKDIYDERKRELYREAYELQNFIKSWFKLKTHLPYEEVKSFFPSYAWPSHKK